MPDVMQKLVFKMCCATNLVSFGGNEKKSCYLLFIFTSGSHRLTGKRVWKVITPLALVFFFIPKSWGGEKVNVLSHHRWLAAMFADCWPEFACNKCPQQFNVFLPLLTLESVGHDENSKTFVRLETFQRFANRRFGLVRLVALWLSVAMTTRAKHGTSVLQSEAEVKIWQLVAYLVKYRLFIQFFFFFFN